MPERFQESAGRPLGEVAAVITGLGSRLKESPRGEPCGIIHVADLGRVREEGHELRRIILAEPERFERAVARAGDIVMSARGYVLCAAVAPRAWDGALLSSNVLSIRPSSVVRPEVLLLLLKTREARAVYEKRSGAGALMLSPRSFDGLRITVPSCREQTAIAELLRLRDREAELVERLAEKRMNLVNTLLLRAVYSHGAQSSHNVA